ncbi:hypothetical protein GWI33_005257 [Rhynchophorus ferrugineus]|uniref:Secreted protein n=1 Tax=Rhynchophorus ferrugineus TaxID=354439 RepID=A0A834INE4_RHYFE|nr:hypothetical protein GWI33_005257 [Rhynchophorus ferrugineus]
MIIFIFFISSNTLIVKSSARLCLFSVSSFFDRRKKRFGFVRSRSKVLSRSTLNIPPEPLFVVNCSRIIEIGFGRSGHIRRPVSTSSPFLRCSRWTLPAFSLPPGVLRFRPAKVARDTGPEREERQISMSYVSMLVDPAFQCRGRV